MNVIQSTQDASVIGTRHAAYLYQTYKAYVLRHKIISVVAAVVLLGVAWYAYAAVTNTSGQTRYVLGTVAQGTIVSSVSASGQVSASQELSLTPKASGQVVYVGVTSGQAVKAGTLIAEIDPTTAAAGVRDAQAGLKSAQLALEKLIEPADALSTAQTDDALTSAQNSTRTDLVSSYLDFTAIMSDLTTINQHVSANQYGQWTISYNASITNLRTQAGQDYDAANAAYQTAFADYTSADVTTADPATLERLAQETATAASLANTAVKSASGFLHAFQNAAVVANYTVPSTASGDITTLDSDGTKLSSHISSLGNDSNSIEENSLSVQKLQTGADPIDVQTAQLSVTKAQDAVTEAENTLAEYYIRAPFDGVIGDVNVHKYDQAGSTAVATLVTNSQVADLSLNEVDAAKIQAGDKATLTFDAIPNLTLTGTVAEIDPVGTVTQGVVSYDVKIAFDAQNSSVKTGMSVNASIQSAVHANVLTVPASAIKTSGTTSYVLAFVPPIASSTANAGSAGVLSSTAPQMIPVTTGISDNTNTEIDSGLTLGQQIVVRGVTGTTAVRTTTTASSATGAARTTGGGGFGGSGGGAAAIRI